jgi:putative PIN family toxin of toxin-antitoxin system
VPLRVAVDTNQFFSATILKRGHPFLLIEAWRNGRFLLVIGDYQRREIGRALAKPETLARYGVTEAERNDVLGAIEEGAESVKPVETLPLPVRDPKDEPILASALGGDADYLVTGDADLIVLDGDPRLGKLRIVTARAFLGILRQQSAEEWERDDL